MQVVEVPRQSSVAGLLEPLVPLDDRERDSAARGLRLGRHRSRWRLSRHGMDVPGPDINADTGFHPQLPLASLPRLPRMTH